MWVALAGTGAGLRVAAAQPVVPSARLEVAAEPSCTTRADLVARVQARSPRLRFLEESGTIGILAQFSVAPSGAVTGNVTLAAPGAEASVRRVLAHSCGEAADAVALIIAVTLDPSAADRGKGTDAVEAVPVERAAPAPASVPSPPRRDANAADSDAASSAPPVHGSETFGVQLAAQSFVGPAPGVMPGIALYATLGIDRPALWSPAVLLGATHVWRTNIGEQGGTASFTLDAASFDACPFRLRLGLVEARPCASALVGRLAAEGSETRNAASRSRRPFWVVGGAAVATAELAWLLELSARLAVGANLVRDSFEFTPIVFHRVPAVTASGSVGIGLRWR